MAKEYAQKFYKSKAWIKCRESYIASVYGMCEECLRRGQLNQGWIVHHKNPITPRNINDPSITLNHDNLEYLCQVHHNVIHGSNIIREDVMFDDDGNLIER
jgi:5-methylcytosine-specific restriction enzyme A